MLLWSRLERPASPRPHRAAAEEVSAARPRAVAEDSAGDSAAADHFPGFRWPWAGNSVPMKPNSRLQAVAAAIGGAALAAMGALTVTTGPGPTAELATINAPFAPPMTTGQTVTMATGLNATTTTSSPLSFSPVVTATPAAPAVPGD